MLKRIAPFVSILCLIMASSFALAGGGGPLPVTQIMGSISCDSDSPGGNVKPGLNQDIMTWGVTVDEGVQMVYTWIRFDTDTPERLVERMPSCGIFYGEVMVRKSAPYILGGDVFVFFYTPVPLFPDSGEHQFTLKADVETSEDSSPIHFTPVIDTIGAFSLWPPIVFVDFDGMECEGKNLTLLSGNMKEYTDEEYAGEVYLEPSTPSGKMSSGLERETLRYTIKAGDRDLWVFATDIGIITGTTIPINIAFPRALLWNGPYLCDVTGFSSLTETAYMTSYIVVRKNTEVTVSLELDIAPEFSGKFKPVVQNIHVFDYWTGVPVQLEGLPLEGKPLIVK